jgi:hypothetical protein
VIACGHAAGYAIDLQARQPGTFTRLVLIAPTWRGPLPTMMSGRKPIQARIRRLIHARLIGELIYRLNVSRPVVRMMYRRHVFADPASLTDDLLAERMRVARPEMAALATLSGIESRLLERGTLGMAEELAADVAPLIDEFLSAKRPPSAGHGA